MRIVSDIKDIPRELRPEARLAWDAGWAILGTNGGHTSWRSPDGVTNIHVPGTSCCRRGIANVRAKLRAAGLGSQPGRNRKSGGRS